MTHRNEPEVTPKELLRQKEFLNTIKANFSANYFEKNGRKPRCCVVTYGCQMNERDSEHIYGMLLEAGFEKEDDRFISDVIIFNTCCVREHAEKRVFGNIGALQKLKKARPEVIIGVCGCMMQQQEVAKKLYQRFPFVDIVFGTHVLYSFGEILYNAIKGQRVIDVRSSEGVIAENLPTLRAMAQSAFVTIMYGCNNYCTYCIVPYVRGRERSRNPEDICNEISDLIASGCKEITLLGQNVNSYGKDLQDKNLNFANLLKRIDNMQNMVRIRFMTSHPKDLSDEVIEVIANSLHICHHIHLPVQSGSSKILQNMNRKYTREDYILLTKRIKSAMPDAELTTDMIVGFPGETEEDFEQTLLLADEVGFAAMYSFMYSKRAGTPACDMQDQVDESVKKQRLLALNNRQALVCEQNNQKHIGTSQLVLVEGVSSKDNGGLLYGKTDNFKVVYFGGSEDLIGSIVKIKINSAKSNSLFGMIKE